MSEIETAPGAGGPLGLQPSPVAASEQTAGRRNYQEDATLILPGQGGAITIVVCDGMGGHAGGAIASKAAIEGFRGAWLDAQGSPAERLDVALDAANAAIRTARQDPRYGNMGCTLVAATVRHGRVVWISVGDSPLYLVRGPDDVRRLNKDHSLRPVLDLLAQTGEISEETARTDPGRNSLRSALTGEKIAIIDRNEAEIDLRAGHRLIAGSDGIDTLTETELARIATQATTAAAAARAIVAAVEAAGRPDQDNATAIVVMANPEAGPTTRVASPAPRGLPNRPATVPVTSFGRATPESRARAAAARLRWLVPVALIVALLVALGGLMLWLNWERMTGDPADTGAIEELPPVPARAQVTPQLAPAAAPLPAPPAQPGDATEATGALPGAASPLAPVPPAGASAPGAPQ